MHIRSLAAAILLFLVYSCASETTSSTTMVGEWVPQSAELGGKEFPVTSFAGATLKMTAQGYDFAGDKGTYTLMEEETPARIDIHGVEGPNAGRDIPAIYQLDGDRLTVCYQLGIGERPTEFKSPEGTQVFLVHYQRKSE